MITFLANRNVVFMISIAIFLIIQGRVAEGIFVDGQRHYFVMFFSVIINACWLLKISFFLGYTIGSPLATTPLNIHLIIDNKLTKSTIKILEFLLPGEK